MSYSIGDPEHPSPDDSKYDDIGQALEAAQDRSKYNDSVMAVWDETYEELIYLCFGGEVFSK